MSRDGGGEAPSRRRYSAEDRTRVLGDVGRLGICGAARAHGVPQSCVSRWQKREGATAAGAAGAETGSLVTAGAGAGAGSAVGKQAAVGSAAPLPVPAPEAASAPEKPGVARKYTPSEKAQALEVVAARGVRVASRKLGISRFSLYQWRRQVKRAAEGKGSSPTSGPAPADIVAQRDREILGEWHKHPGARSQPDPQPAAAARGEGLDEHRAARDGGRRLPAAQGPPSAAR